MHGEVSPILITEGVWDSKTVSSMYSAGLGGGDVGPSGTVKGAAGTPAGSEHKIIMCVSPARCAMGRMHVDESDPLGLGIGGTLTEMAGGLLDRLTKPGDGVRDREKEKVGLGVTSPPGRGKKGSRDEKAREETDVHHAEVGGWLQTHCTQTLPDVLAQIGGVALVLKMSAPVSDVSQVLSPRISESLCLPLSFLLCNHPHKYEHPMQSQVAALRVLARLLARGGDELMAEFARLHGEKVRPCYLCINIKMYVSNIYI